MNARFGRLISLILIPCLLVDPALAYSRASSPVGGKHETLFKQQALVPGLVEWAPHPFHRKASLNVIAQTSLARLSSDSKLWLGRAVAVGLIIPAALALAILIPFVKVGSPGPIFYSAERLGYREKKITVYKLRTKTNEPDERLKIDSWFGKWVRNTGLDEIPQLYSILKGDMQWFGARPRMIDQVSDEFKREVLYLSRPGIFGKRVLREGIGKSVSTASIEEARWDAQDHSALYYAGILFSSVKLVVRELGKSYTLLKAETTERLEIKRDDALETRMGRLMGEMLLREYTLDPMKARALEPLIKTAKLYRENNMTELFFNDKRLVEISALGTHRFFDLDGRWILTVASNNRAIDQLAWDENSHFKEGWTMAADGSGLTFASSHNDLVENYHAGKRNPILVQEVKDKNNIPLLRFSPGIDFNDMSKIPYADGKRMDWLPSQPQNIMGTGQAVMRWIALLAKDQGNTLTYVGNDTLPAEKFPNLIRAHVQPQLYNTLLEVAKPEREGDPDTLYQEFEQDPETFQWRPDPPEVIFRDNMVSYVRSGRIDRIYYSGLFFVGHDFLLDRQSNAFLAKNWLERDGNSYIIWKGNEPLGSLTPEGHITSMTLPHMMPKEKRHPMRLIDPGISSDDDGGETRQDHLDYHDRGKFASVIKFVISEVIEAVKASDYEKETHLKGPWFNFKAFLEYRFIRGLGVKSPYGITLKALNFKSKIRLEPDGIVVIIDPRFKADHAGRSGIVMARNEAKARHELADLRTIAAWAVEKDVVARTDVMQGKLGKGIREWLNDTNASPRELAKRDEEFNRVKEEAHENGKRAEKLNPNQLVPNGFRIRFGGMPEWAVSGETGSPQGRDGIISSESQIDLDEKEVDEPELESEPSSKKAPKEDTNRPLTMQELRGYSGRVLYGERICTIRASDVFGATPYNDDGFIFIQLQYTDSIVHKGVLILSMRQKISPFSVVRGKARKKQKISSGPQVIIYLPKRMVVGKQRFIARGQTLREALRALTEQVSLQHKHLDTVFFTASGKLRSQWALRRGYTENGKEVGLDTRLKEGQMFNLKLRGESNSMPFNLFSNRKGEAIMRGPDLRPKLARRPPRTRRPHYNLLPIPKLEPTSTEAPEEGIPYEFRPEIIAAQAIANKEAAIDVINEYLKRQEDEKDAIAYLSDVYMALVSYRGSVTVSQRVNVLFVRNWVSQRRKALGESKPVAAKTVTPPTPRDVIKATVMPNPEVRPAASRLSARKTEPLARMNQRPSWLNTEKGEQLLSTARHYLFLTPEEWKFLKQADWTVYYHKNFDPQIIHEIATLHAAAPFKGPEDFLRRWLPVHYVHLKNHTPVAAKTSLTYFSNRVREALGKNHFYEAKLVKRSLQWLKDPQHEPQIEVFLRALPQSDIPRVQDDNISKTMAGIRDTRESLRSTLDLIPYFKSLNVLYKFTRMLYEHVDQNPRIMRVAA